MALNSANWKIDHQCPQCGAPVLLDEADRLLACPFCRTSLYLVTPDHFRYHIPALERRDKDMFYLPYWRLRGSTFSVNATYIRYWQICGFPQMRSCWCTILFWLAPVN